QPRAAVRRRVRRGGPPWPASPREAEPEENAPGRGRARRRRDHSPLLLQHPTERRQGEPRTARQSGPERLEDPGLVSRLERGVLVEQLDLHASLRGAQREKQRLSFLQAGG